MIYIILFLFFAVLVCLDLINDFEWFKYSFFIFSIILCIFLSSIRWNTGPDWASYFVFYRDIELYAKGRLIPANLMEPGFTKLNLWVRQLGLSYTGFLTIIAILTIGLKAKVIYHHKAIMMVTLFLYYCYYLADITSVRQFTAVSLTLYSVLFIIRRKPIIFFFYVLAASSIHITSIFFLSAYWLYHRPHKPWVLGIWLIITLLLGVTHVADYLINFIIHVATGGSNIAIKLLNYKSQGMESTPHPYLTFVLGVLKRAIVLPLFFWGVNFIDEKYKERYIGYLNLLVFGNGIYFLFALSIPVLQRLSFPFLIFEIFIWGYLVISIKDLKLRFTLCALLLAFGAFRLYFFIAPYKDLYFPFKTIF